MRRKFERRRRENLPKGEFISPFAFQSRRVPAGACPGGRKPGYEAQKAELEKRL